MEEGEGGREGGREGGKGGEESKGEWRKQIKGVWL